jgi:hypothetical protein
MLTPDGPVICGGEAMECGTVAQARYPEGSWLTSSVRESIIVKITSGINFPPVRDITPTDCRQ